MQLVPACKLTATHGSNRAVEEVKNMPSKKSKRMGRPALPKGEVKGVTKAFKCTSEEFNNYQNAAQAKGLDFSKWARQILNKAVKKR